MKTKINNVFYHLSRKAFSAVFVLIATFFLLPAVSTQADEAPSTQMQPTPTTKTPTWADLEKIKSRAQMYSSQLQVLQTQDVQTAQDIAATEDKISMLDKDLNTAKTRLAEVQAEALELQKTKDELVSRVYILGSTDSTLSALFSAGDFANFMDSSNYSKELLENFIDQITQITTKLDAVSAEAQVLEVQNQSLQDQKNALLAQKEVILASIKEKQGLIAASVKEQYNLEKQILNSNLLDSKNERDFIKYNFADGDTFTFYGGGSEHGLGMSQYGAKGMAERGYSYRTILNHYYNKTQVTDTGNNPEVKILVATGTGKIYARGGSWRVAGKTGNLAANGFVDFGAGHFTVFDASGRPTKQGSYSQKLTLQSLSSDTRFELAFKNSYFDTYRGNIEVTRSGGQSLVINKLPVESYLRGVVPAECSAAWPLDALKAQALAARSYAYRHLGGSPYDMDDTQQFQVYLGSKWEAGTSDSAVSETAGEVITYDGQIIPAYYHSTSGGYTENNDLIWGGEKRPYLRAVSSPYETDSPYWSWQTRSYTKAELQAILATSELTKVAGFTSLKVVSRGTSGRIIALEVIGSKETKRVSGADFKQVFNAAIAPNEAPLNCTLFGVK